MVSSSYPRMPTVVSLSSGGREDTAAEYNEIDMRDNPVTILSQKDQLKKYSSKSTIELELDVNGTDTDGELEEEEEIDDDNTLQPMKTPSLLCGQTYFKLRNWSIKTIKTIINKVLSLCDEISYEFVEMEFKWNALYLECSHHCQFEIRIYEDKKMTYTVEMTRLSGEGKCFNKLFGTFKETLLNHTSVESLNISVAANNYTVNICDNLCDSLSVSESEVIGTLKSITNMACANKYEAQCETSRMLCMLSKRLEIHSYICQFGIVTVLVKDFLSTRYSPWTRQHAMLALAGLSVTTTCQECMINAGILPLLIGLIVDCPYDTLEMSRKAAKTFMNLTSNPDMAIMAIKKLTPRVVVMWISSVSHLRDSKCKVFADTAKQSLIKALKEENIPCNITSHPINPLEINEGNKASTGVITNLMLASQTSHHEISLRTNLNFSKSLNNINNISNTNDLNDLNNLKSSHVDDNSNDIINQLPTPPTSPSQSFVYTSQYTSLPSSPSSQPSSTSLTTPQESTQESINDSQSSISGFSSGFSSRRSSQQSIQSQQSAQTDTQQGSQPGSQVYTKAVSKLDSKIDSEIGTQIVLTVDLVLYYLDTGVSVLAYSPDGSTALMYAAQYGNIDVVRLLVSRGANIEQQRKDGCTAIQLAAARGHRPIVSYLLLNIGAFLSSNKKGMDAFLFAAQNGHLEVVTLLLDYNPLIINNTRHDFMSGLDLAIDSNHLKLVSLLQARGCRA